VFGLSDGSRVQLVGVAVCSIGLCSKTKSEKRASTAGLKPSISIPVLAGPAKTTLPRETIRRPDLG